MVNKNMMVAASYFMSHTHFLRVNVVTTWANKQSNSKQREERREAILLDYLRCWKSAHPRH